MKYKAVFLDDAEFESLPYRDMGEKIGVADPHTRTAYARKSGIPVIDAFTIMHELEHLEEGHEGVHADHYDPELGVYYKGFDNLFSAIGGGLSNMGGAVDRGASNVGGALSSGAGAISRGVGGLFGGGQGMSGVGKQAIPSPYGMSANASKGSILDPFTSSRGAFTGSFGSGAGPSGGGVSPNLLFNPNSPKTMPSTSGSGFMNSLNKFMPSVSSAISNLMPGGFNPAKQSPVFPGQGGGGGSPQPPPTPQPAPQLAAAPATNNVAPPAAKSPLSSIFGENTNFAKVGTGAALAGFGQLASPKVKVPNIMELPSVQALQQKNFGSFRELDPELQAAINRDFDAIDARERDRLISTYKSLRPGADIQSDSSFARDMAELQDSQGKRRVDSIAKYRFEYLSKQLQLSELELKQMVSLAALDVFQIAQTLEIDVAAAKEFKDAFGGLGGRMIAKGAGLGPQEDPVKEEPTNAVL